MRRRYAITGPFPADRPLEALGIWDEGADGLFQNHEVAIWSIGNSEAPLAEVTVSSASQQIPSTQSSGLWLLQALNSPISLSAGAYVVGAYYSVGFPTPSGVDHVRIQAPLPPPISVSTDPAIQFVSWRFATNPSQALAFPNGIVAANGAFGPNVLISPVVPEPSAFALALLGVVTIIAAKRSRRFL